MCWGASICLIWTSRSENHQNQGKKRKNFDSFHIEINLFCETFGFWVAFDINFITIIRLFSTALITLWLKKLISLILKENYNTNNNVGSLALSGLKCSYALKCTMWIIFVGKYS